MSDRNVRLTKDGHDYVFTYAPGYEAQAVDEMMAMAVDAETDFDWMDAAALGLQVACGAAADCRTEIMSPPQTRRSSPEPSGAEHRRGGDDAKDGPCTNHNLP